MKTNENLKLLLEEAKTASSDLKKAKQIIERIKKLAELAHLEDSVKEQIIDCLLPIEINFVSKETIVPMASIIESFGDVDLLYEYNKKTFADLTNDELEKTLKALKTRYQNKRNFVTEEYLYDLVFNRKNIDIPTEYAKISTNVGNKNTLENFFKKYLDKPEILRSHNMINLLSVLTELGGFESINILVEIGFNTISDQNSVYSVLDSLEVLIYKLKGLKRKESEENFVNYLIKAAERWPGNQKIIREVALILERWKPRLITKGNREYWDYDATEVLSMLKSIQQVNRKTG